jgi:hypothetical protein
VMSQYVSHLCPSLKSFASMRVSLCPSTYVNTARKERNGGVGTSALYGTFENRLGHRDTGTRNAKVKRPMSVSKLRAPGCEGNRRRSGQDPDEVGLGVRDKWAAC